MEITRLRHFRHERHWTGFLIGLCLAALCCGCRGKSNGRPPGASPPPSGAPALSGVEPAEAWMPLFDGRSFAGWRGIGMAGIPEGHWVIEDGAIKKVPQGEVPRQADGQPVEGGDLMTDATFEDFDLRLEWKISPGGNSGIKYNVSEEISLSVPPRQAAIGFEYQIIDDSAHPDAAHGPNRTAGALYDLIAPVRKTLKPVGEYNEARIVFRGRHGEHWLNGEKILEYELETPEMNGRLKMSKYRDIPDFAAKRAGHIVLQDHGDAVWFRNIRICRLKPE